MAEGNEEEKSWLSKLSPRYFLAKLKELLPNDTIDPNEALVMNYVCSYCQKQPLTSENTNCENCRKIRLLLYSQHATHQYHSDQGQSYDRVCQHPNCGKPCYFDERTQRIYDYCGRTHATEHRKMLEEQQRQLHMEYYRHQPHTSGSTSTQTSSWWNKGPIKFYNRDEPYYEFTNFYPAPVIIDDLQWLTTEHYFQAQKFIGTPYVEHIRCLDTPREAFDFSRHPQVSYWRRNDWEEVKIDVMHKALLAKFTQDDYLKKKLLSTGKRKLVEHTYRDSFWGDGGDGSGQNHLGKLLMKVRNELRGKGKKKPEESSVDKEPSEKRVKTDSVQSTSANEEDEGDSESDDSEEEDDSGSQKASNKNSNEVDKSELGQEHSKPETTISLNTPSSMDGTDNDQEKIQDKSTNSGGSEDAASLNAAAETAEKHEDRPEAGNSDQHKNKMEKMDTTPPLTCLPSQPPTTQDSTPTNSTDPPAPSFPAQPNSQGPHTSNENLSSQATQIMQPNNDPANATANNDNQQDPQEDGRTATDQSNSQENKMDTSPVPCSSPPSQPLIPVPVTTNLIPVPVTTNLLLPPVFFIMPNSQEPEASSHTPELNALISPGGNLSSQATQIMQDNPAITAAVPVNVAPDGTCSMANIKNQQDPSLKKDGRTSDQLQDNKMDTRPVPCPPPPSQPLLPPPGFFTLPNSHEPQAFSHTPGFDTLISPGGNLSSQATQIMQDNPAITAAVPAGPGGACTTTAKAEEVQSESNDVCIDSSDGDEL